MAMQPISRITCATQTITRMATKAKRQQVITTSRQFWGPVGGPIIGPGSKKPLGLKGQVTSNTLKGGSTACRQLSCVSLKSAHRQSERQFINATPLDICTMASKSVSQV
eukprot:CAMPEP_0114686382 /NCGR_PEP_ID=MMETSP0191-20121206/61443_1 /TAXON_ID=126664 /ORGANISM="Sorites sp." /LENGTH=108 /DNA_ID=CAMNT_0001971851 /DNA_START=73 /DNA_END=399 /DNA_ORIENTATION=+